jgi:hypothetical protein
LEKRRDETNVLSSWTTDYKPIVYKSSAKISSSRLVSLALESEQTDSERFLSCFEYLYEKESVEISFFFADEIEDTGFLSVMAAT